MLRDLIKYNLIKNFSKIVYGFCDSLNLFWKSYPERKETGMCKLSKLALDFLNIDETNENFHEATYDVYILQRLVNEKLSVNDVLQNSQELTSSVKNFLNKRKTKTFSALKGTISDYMIKKIALSGSTYDDLKLIFINQGKEALHNFFTELVNSKPRITKDKKIIQTIIEHFKSNEKELL